MPLSLSPALPANAYPLLLNPNAPGAPPLANTPPSTRTLDKSKRPSMDKFPPESKSKTVLSAPVTLVVTVKTLWLKVLSRLSMNKASRLVPSVWAMTSLPLVGPAVPIPTRPLVASTISVSHLARSLP